MIKPFSEIKKQSDQIWPICHFTPMEEQWGDDGCQQVSYYECVHCGHTIEIDRILAG